jgi:ribosome-associated toxin RatA of RatAB toxin-antitoxin module
MGTIKVEKTDTINASADKLWHILSDEFTDVGKWASSVDYSEANAAATDVPAGAEVGGRTCEVPGFGFTDERFTRYDEANKTFSFSVEAEKIPGFFKNMESTWKVVPLGPETSRVTTRVAGEATGVMGAMVKPMMTRKFNGTINQVYEDLKVYAETDTISPAKAKAQAKYDKKRAKAKA